MKNLLKPSATAWSSEIIFTNAISSWPSWEKTFFDKRYFRFCFYFISKKGFTVFQKVLLFAMSLVLTLLKAFFFSLLNKLTQRSRCLLYAFLSMLLFVFKTLFLKRNLYMISLFFFLFMKDIYGSMSSNIFIKSCLKSVELKFIVLKSY